MISEQVQLLSLLITAQVNELYPTFILYLFYRCLDRDPQMNCFLLYSNSNLTIFLFL